MICLAFCAYATDAAQPVQTIPSLLESSLGRVVLLDFWASWCAPCRRSFPWMADLQQRLERDGLTVIAVNVDHDRALADRFLARSPAGFRVEYDDSGSLAGQFGVQAMPTSIVIDRGGKIRYRHSGFRDAQRAEREREIIQLLQEP